MLYRARIVLESQLEYNLGEMSCFNQHHAVQWIWIPFRFATIIANRTGQSRVDSPVPGLRLYVWRGTSKELSRDSVIADHVHNNVLRV